MVKKTTKQPRLTLHQLLGAISFWGSATRLLLLAFLVIVIFVLRITNLDTTLTWESQVIIYILGSFALLDIGYVMLARAFPLKKRPDIAILVGLEIFMAATYILPHIMNVRGLSWISNWLLLIALLALALRGLVGMLFTSKKRA